MKHPFRSINSFASMYRHQADDGKPELTYVLKPKLHGTNASILIDSDGLFQCRSKNRVLSATDDHMDFTKTMLTYEETWKHWLKEYDQPWALVMGEWAGPGVQRHDAISLIDKKRFFTFSVRLEDGIYNDNNSGIDEAFEDNDRVWDIPIMKRLNIPFDIMTDMDPTVKIINDLVESFEEVDPYVKGLFDVEGCGEGIVGTPIYSPTSTHFFDHAFKAKTEAHRVKKTGVPASIREPLPQEALQFASVYVTEPRMRQAISELGIDNPDMKNTADIIKWMNADIIKESLDDVADMGMDYDKLSKPVNTLIVRMWKGFVHGSIS